MSTRHGFSVRGLEVPGVSIRPRDGSAGCSPPWSSRPPASVRFAQPRSAAAAPGTNHHAHPFLGLLVRTPRNSVSVPF